MSPSNIFSNKLTDLEKRTSAGPVFTIPRSSDRDSGKNSLREIIEIEIFDRASYPLRTQKVLQEWPQKIVTRESELSSNGNFNVMDNSNRSSEGLKSSHDGHIVTAISRLSNISPKPLLMKH